jgi:hypothetical protein
MWDPRPALRAKDDQMTRFRRRRRLEVSGAIFFAGIAAWDLVTNGSVLVAVAASILALILSFGAVFPKTTSHVLNMPPTDPSWFSRVAFATGFPSSRSLASRSVLGVAAVTLIQRFGLYPSAALAFDVFIAIAALAIMLLFSFFIARARYQQ